MIMNKKTILTVLAVAVISSSALMAGNDGTLSGALRPDAREFKEALRLYGKGLTARASSVLESLPEGVCAITPEEYAVLSDVVMNVPGYRCGMEEFLKKNPESVLASQIRYRHALNLFDLEDYPGVMKIFSKLYKHNIDKEQIDEFLFKHAYSALECGYLDKAKRLFEEVAGRNVTDYSAPARYALGYINYGNQEFQTALDWFEDAAEDQRFRDLAEYYILECRFMLKDYKYVTDNGEAMYESVPEARKSHLARIISESWLVQDEVEKAREYYDLGADGTEAKTRSDWFYGGSLLYALDDFEGAVASYGKMTERSDSLGQIANYHLGYSYIQLKNKVAALGAFKDAAQQNHDLQIKEDAFFNWAKLAFDLNEDTSVFNDYIKTYPAKEQEQRINSYIAVAALHDRDYEGAVNAYDKIDELDEGMVSNYMKANYLRANQLIRSGSYRMAIPCLKAAAYYSDRGSRFNQMSRFWLAESYFRNDQYKEALDVFTDLYNTLALYGQQENEMLPYNIAYCHFQSENYSSALRWFEEYLLDPAADFRKEALIRTADCHFMSKEYKKACAAYDVVIDGYFDVNDIYPYYQGALAYGLAKNSSKKIELLSNVLKASPSSEFYPEALYELGRSYVAKYEDDEAQECFRLLADNVKDSTYVAKAYIEMGSLARNQSQYNEALGYYKTVVEEMPMSGYAEDALAAIESIYQIRNRPQDYLDYIETIGKGATKTEDEKEDMIFNSAEQIFLSENYQKALVSLESYLTQYPDGNNAYKAEFYMAESYRLLGKLEQACDHYAEVIEGGEGSFVELSMLNFSDISFKLERWDDAFGGYSSLLSAALLDNNKTAAQTGMMRSAFKGHKWEEAIKSADAIMTDTRTEPLLYSEAQYVKAKSYLAGSRRDEAFAILEKLAEDVTGVYGAEAAYMLILDSYDRGDFDEVENKVFAFSDAGSPQVYWLAKSFIVLGDSFVDRDELEQAKATFESVRDGYEPQGSDDDVKSNVEVRLTKLEEMMKKQ